MHITLYESSSHGGCYKYAIELYHAYSQHPEVESITLLLPRNATFDGEGVKKILIADSRPGSRLHFLYRHFVNPLRLLWHMKHPQRSQKNENKQTETSTSSTQTHRHSGTSSSFLLLNDFEQISAPLWSPLFRWLLKQHTTGVFLHDADRDAYPPSPMVSAWCMKQMMKSMDLALHHGTLPARSYYHPNGRTNYLRVKHGLYHLPDPDKDLLNHIRQWTANYVHVMGIIGHIRLEKNYSYLMQAIAQKADICLIVAGSPANSNINVEALKEEAELLGIAHRVLWIDRFLSEPEMTAVIEACHTIALYYASTFHSQSGILNQVATLKKKVIVSDLPNALTETVKKYGLGHICEADNLEALTHIIQQIDNTPIDPDWDRFFEEVDWKKQVECAIEKIKKDH